jgi:murein endopeptidase
MRALLLTALVAALPSFAEPVAEPAPEVPVSAAPVVELVGAFDAGLDVVGEPLDIEDPDVGEGEASEAEVAVAGGGDGGVQYSADLSDDELARRFVEDPASLGSVSVGLVEAGRVMNAVHVGQGEAWTLVSPEHAWGTQEAVDGLRRVAQVVHELYPAAAPLRINHLGRRDGGYLRPHQSHQSGRDVDLGFYYRAGMDPRALSKRREQAMDLAVNWALVRALVTEADVQFILVDRRIQKALYEYALGIGEDKAWLDSLFHGAEPLLKHARRHRDHFHVRFYAPRSQELGRRVQPLLAQRPEENLLIHRVRRGDTLGRLAVTYGSTVRLIQKANGLSGHALRVGRTLNIPLRGPCTSCPVPPPLVVPPRRLPPERPRV